MGVVLAAGVLVGCTSSGDADEATEPNGDEATKPADSGTSAAGAGRVTFTATDASCEITGEGDLHEGAQIAVTFVNDSSVTLTITIRDQTGDEIASTTGFLDPGENEHSPDYGFPAGEYTTACTHMQGEPTWTSEGTGTTPRGAAPPTGDPLVVVAG